MNSWYEESFGSDYLIVYKHRDLQGAYQEVKQIIDWLHLPKGAEVLDLCCGMGRHSMALKDFGYRVTGVDLSEVLLAEARKMDVRGEIRWVKGDMRQVPLRQTFDAVVNLFTAFGYFEPDEENGKVLCEIARLLKPDGKFIIDFLNPHYVAAHLVPYSERTEGNLTIQESRRIEDGFVRKTIVIRQPGEPDRHYLEQVKLYSREKFLDMLRKAGLKPAQVFGDYDGAAYDPAASPRMIFIGGKSA
jgi:ubiquinone/menaquinone biosynthesis C-methylase UbiE